MLFLTNSFSVHMMPRMSCGEWEDIRFRRIGAKEACRILQENKFRSFFGHAETVKILESIWRMKIPVSRGIAEFRKGDSMIIATIIGKREREQGMYSHRGTRFDFYLVEYQ